jgi:hypothetical protein
MANEIEKPEHDYFALFASTVLANRVIVGDLLTFNKFGEYTAGRDRTPIELGTKLTAHVSQLMTGWVRWEDNRPAEQEMDLVAKGFRPPKRAELGHLDKAAWVTNADGVAQDPWQLTNYLIFSDPGNGQLFTYSTSSRGGINAIGELAKAYSDHCRQLPGEYPVVELGKGSYRHSNKAYGEIRYPVFKVTSWVPRKGPDALLGDEEDDASTQIEEKPAPKASKKAPPAAPRI